MSNGSSIIENAKAKHSSPECDLLVVYATELTKALRFLRDAFINRHGGFPQDESTDSERLWVAAMTRAYELVGRGRGVGELEAREALQRQGVE